MIAAAAFALGDALLSVFARLLTVDHTLADFDLDDVAPEHTVRGAVYVTTAMCDSDPTMAHVHCSAPTCNRVVWPTPMPHEQATQEMHIHAWEHEIGSLA